MKRILFLFLCILTVFVIASCKEEPEDTPSSEESFYRLTATREAKRFALQYTDLTPDVGDELTFEYRSSHPVTHLYLRNAEGSGSISKVDIDDYISEPDGDGWITFKFTFDEALDGIRLELANYLTPETGAHDEGVGKFEPGDYLDIMDLAINGEILEIGEAEDGQSNAGVWNNTNTDHVHPTLEIKYL